MPCSPIPPSPLSACVYVPRMGRSESLAVGEEKGNGKDEVLQRRGRAESRWDWVCESALHQPSLLSFPLQSIDTPSVSVASDILSISQSSALIIELCSAEHSVEEKQAKGRLQSILLLPFFLSACLESCCSRTAPGWHTSCTSLRDLRSVPVVCAARLSPCVKQMGKGNMQERRR